jgi:four helix bundle protein
MVSAIYEGGIAERSVKYARQVIAYFKTLEKNDVTRILGRQLLRSGTSVGANIHEAQGGQSRADFLCKMQVAHKEARESAYWLRLLGEEQAGEARMEDRLLQETREIIRILGSIILTTKQNSPTPAGRRPRTSNS